jgi:hypothetical protein
MAFTTENRYAHTLPYSMMHALSILYATGDLPNGKRAEHPKFLPPLSLKCVYCQVLDLKNPEEFIL